MTAPENDLSLEVFKEHSPLGCEMTVIVTEFPHGRAVVTI